MVVKIIMLFCGLVSLLEMLNIFLRRLYEIIDVKMGLLDPDINAIVVGFVPLITGEVQPIIQYNIEGIEKNYVYHCPCGVDVYSVGDVISLKLSEKSQLAYDKKDLYRGLMMQAFRVVAILLGVLYLLLDII